MAVRLAGPGRLRAGDSTAAFSLPCYGPALRFQVEASVASASLVGFGVVDARESEEPP